MNDRPNQSHDTEKTTDHAAVANGQDATLATGDRPGSREEHLEDRIHQVLEQKLISLLDNESTNREIHWLRRQVNWSIGFLVALIIVLGGAFTWFAYRLQTRVQPTPQTATPSEIAPEDLEQLEQFQTEIQNQIQTLGDRIPENLPETLSTNQDQLQSVSERLATLESAVSENQQSLTDLETSIEDLDQSLQLGERGLSNLQQESDSGSNSR
ncbi:MAG: hypothetical protein ACFE0J_21135 [Elainellaceae cyanobacterium]